MLLRPSVPPAVHNPSRHSHSWIGIPPHRAPSCHRRSRGALYQSEPDEQYPQTAEYLDNLSQREDGKTLNENEVNGDRMIAEENDAGEGESAQDVYEDDDYAMSIPSPVKSEEPEDVSLDDDLGGAGGEGDVEKKAEEDEVSIVGEGAAVHPNYEPPSGDADLDVVEPRTDILSSTPEMGSTEKEGDTKGIKSMIQNFLTGNDDVKTKEERERARKWSEWMKSGRKVRDDTSPSSDGEDSSEVALEESILSVDKGADYVVVAVPPEVAEGVGPVLSSFPGGKRFQKKVIKTYQEDAVNGDVATAGSSSNSTTTVSPTVAIKKKKPESRKKKKVEKEEDVVQKQRRRRQKHFRERRPKEFGRISAGDWRHNMHNLPSSTILRDVRNPVVCVFVWATLWSALYKGLTKLLAAAATESGALPVPSPRWMTVASWLARHMRLPAVQHSMMTSALSLLLVFKTNSAYQRFAEGRKIWNDIVDTTRDFSRMCKLYEFAIGTSKCRRINNLLASFPYLLRQRIRPSLMAFNRVNDSTVERDPENSLLLYPDESLRDTDPEVGALAYDEEETGTSRRKTRELCWVDKRTMPWKLLPGPALELCARAQNRPLWVCDRLAKELAVVDDLLPKFTNRERLALIGYVDKLSRSIGACERIHQTVVPLNYARHALRSLTVWLWTLPFALVKDLGLLTGPVVGVVSWILFGVYEIGTRIEDPFQGTLRLSIYCDAIRRDVLADAIARDTAFDLEEEGKSYADEEGDYDAIIELESESEEYDGDDAPTKKNRKRDFLGSLGFSSKSP
ncbi:hypothetical protein ACHAXT_002712 [Thalassiosira profunda]